MPFVHKIVHNYFLGARDNSKAKMLASIYPTPGFIIDNYA